MRNLALELKVANIFYQNVKCPMSINTYFKK